MTSFTSIKTFRFLDFLLPTNLQSIHPHLNTRPFLLALTRQGPGNLLRVQSTAQWLFPGSPTGRNPATQGYTVKVMVMVMSRGNGKCKWNLIVNPRSLVMIRREVDKAPLAPGALCCVQHRCDPNFLESFYKDFTCLSFLFRPVKI